MNGVSNPWTGCTNYEGPGSARREESGPERGLEALEHLSPGKEGEAEKGDW